MVKVEDATSAGWQVTCVILYAGSVAVWVLLAQTAILILSLTLSTVGESICDALTTVLSCYLHNSFTCMNE